MSLGLVCLAFTHVQQNPAKPATELTFPSVTICSPGLNMEAVEEAVYKDYKRWNREEGNSEKEVGDFMEEMYAMKVGKGNIFDKIKAMNLPPISQDNEASSVLLENIVTCENTTSSRAKRKKRNSRGKRKVQTNLFSVL